MEKYEPLKEITYLEVCEKFPIWVKHGLKSDLHQTVGGFVWVVWSGKTIKAAVLEFLCSKNGCFYWSSVIIGFRESWEFDFCPHPQGVRPVTKGFSHGLKTCHRHVFLTAFRIPSHHKKYGTRRSGFHIFGRSIGIRTRGLLDPKSPKVENPSSFCPL